MELVCEGQRIMYAVNWKQCLRFYTPVNDYTVNLSCVQVGELCESSQVTRFHITTPEATVIEKKKKMISMFSRNGEGYSYDLQKPSKLKFHNKLIIQGIKKKKTFLSQSLYAAQLRRKHSKH